MINRLTTVFAILCFVIGLHSSAQQPLPFRNTSLSFEVRVNDLVSRLTLEEKVAQMLNAAPAIERLGIPAYDWWSEVLHGVARTPYRVTVFPQAIGMAATFDSSSIKLMAQFSAEEGRAVFNKAIKDGDEGSRYLGLTYWTPNINIFRDPRWGRGQETYGEDPFLTGTMGAAFVRGLQGEDPKYLHAAACAKHYAVHSGPEPLRHVFNAKPSRYDLWNTYLPAFQELVTEAGVAGVMCAYNAFDGQPCCGSDELMIDILRRQWKFTGYVTSDCWAIDDFFMRHKTHENAMTASADAVLHGTDVECGNEAYRTLVVAVKQNLLSEKQIDESVKRLFMIRFRLGLFDPPSMVPYAQTPETVLESEAHKAHALKMAEQSIVLLKNENNTLPLKKSIKKIAVLGPNADNSIAVLGNYNGIPLEIITPLKGIESKLGKDVEVVYEQAVNFTNDTLMHYSDLSKQFFDDGKNGFHAEYFNNKKLDVAPTLVRTEKDLDHNWQEAEVISQQLKALNFSARWSTKFLPKSSGPVTFEISADDGYRFYVNGEKVIDAWDRNRWGAKTYQLNAEKNKSYNLVLEYYQANGNASVQLRTGKYVKTDFAALSSRLEDADAIVFVGGISPQLEGEEMQVNYPGFNGGDRTTIALPHVQTELMKALQKTGKPLVFVMMTGSAIAIPWEAKNVPAIVNAWYGGQSAGTAIANVLFGDYNPAGRLPVTFYSSDTDLPDFSDYSMQNRTYRYFKGEPLFAFGHGLSYTRYSYNNLKVPQRSAKEDALEIEVDVHNAGSRDGEEVVQLYVSQENKTAQDAIRSLKGFQRIFIRAGETKTVRFRLQPEDLSTNNDEGLPQFFTGNVRISVGGSQPDAPSLQEKKVAERIIIRQ
ncbi:MAG: glycoside hydrolase family 3 C-terminal domain-containing protein [Flavisolibacter sp.]